MVSREALKGTSCEMATRDFSVWESCGTSHLNIVLLGGRNSGKSSLGNVILGKEEFVTRERTTCSRRVGEVSGKQWVTVVDTPGWWCDFSLQDTAELVKREIASCVSLCLPRPHVFLIVVKASSFFSRQRQRALEEHVGLLGDGVWDRSIVVFTSADWAEGRTAEQHVQRGGNTLEWLSEKCQRRCHAVAFRSDQFVAQVTELLVGMQRLVTENVSCPFDLDENVLREVTQEKLAVEGRAQRRHVEMKKQRSVMQEQVCRLSDIRTVLVGAKGSGKSSVANTILGREGRPDIGRRTAQSNVQTGCVCGRHVTAVDTPGWWMNYFTEDSPIADKREIVRSPALCPPGPHAFLLVVRVDRAFTETYRRAAQEHLELISERIWMHVMVVFTFADWLGDTTIEQYIESEGKHLQWLVDKCDNRYHVLNNKTKGNGFQVSELIEKIEELAAGNSGHHYEIERTRLQQLEDEMRAEKVKAEERLIKRNAQKQMARLQLEKLKPLSELRVVLVGGRNMGKSSAGNTILGGQKFDTESRTTACVEGCGRVCGKAVTMLDTPGWLSVNPELLVASSACGFTALLLVVNASSSFTPTLLEGVERQLDGVGEEAWSKALVLFTHGDWLGGTNIEQRIESEGEPLQRLVDRCGNRYHVLDNKDWGDGGQVAGLLEQVDEMLVEERLEVLQRSVPVEKDIALSYELRLDRLTQHRGRVEAFPTQGEESVFHDALQVKCSPTSQPLDVLDSLDVCSQVVTPPRASGGTRAAELSIVQRQQFKSGLTSLLHGGEGLQWDSGGQPTLVFNVPVWFPTNYPPRSRLNGKSSDATISRRHQAVVLFLPAEQPQTQTRELVREEENVADVRSLCQPSLRQKTLKKLTETGDLQLLIDQWGSSSVEELEAFIDDYFETVWEEAMGSETGAPDRPAAEVEEQEAVVHELHPEVLVSIEKKLSKLDLLDQMQRDLAELRRSLECRGKSVQDLDEESNGQQGSVNPMETEELEKMT